MKRIQSLTALCAPIIAALLLATGSLGALAKDAGPATTDKPAAPAAASTPLSKEAVREMVSRLSDEEVRRLLIEQLDRAAAPAEADVAGMSDMVGAMDKGSKQMRERAAQILRAGGQLPQAIGHVVRRLTDERGLFHLVEIILGLGAMLLIGWLVETAYRRLLHAPLERIRGGLGASFVDEACRLGLSVGLEAIALVLFYAGAIALFFALYQGHQATRLVVLTVLAAVVVVRAVVIASRILLAPRAPQLRLLPFDDAAAQSIHKRVLWLATLWVGTIAIGILFATLGVDRLVLAFISWCLGTVILLAFIELIWRVRAPIGGMIRGASTGGPRRILADMWPLLATLYFVAIYAARVNDMLTGTEGPSDAAILSVLLIVALPILDMVLCRALSALIGSPTGADARPSILAGYESVLRRAIHIVVTVAGFLILAEVWKLDLFGIARRSLGGQITSSLLGIAIVLLISYMLWEVVNTAIGRRMKAETPQDAVTPASRLRTLLPLFRMVLLATIFVMATLSLLAALGVDILPLLAGASVVGVAIGFGSQTLVRDIVTGAFFLLDDAFRLGEYIEVGSTKGRIEKLTARSVFLRHHRGQLNVLPYGEIRQLKNNSRDWMIMKLEFRLTYDTDLNLVKKIMKKIGAELQADPELGTDIIETLKSQGVYSTEDSALVVRAKFMAKPGSTVFMIRRVAYDKILKAFKEHGIKFAHRQVTVLVPGSEDEATAAKAAAGAAALAAAQAEGKPGGGA